LPEARESPLGRAIWSGSISFGLVTVPVELFSAWRRRGGPALRMLGPSGSPLRREYVCPRDERVLAGDEIERGYEVSEGEFVVVTDDELERVAPERSRDISLERFVPRDAIDPAYFVRSYVLLPGGEQVKAYALLADTMESSGRAAIARFVMRGKSYAVAIFADHGVLRASTLRFGDEVRDTEALGVAPPGEIDAAALRKMAAQVKQLAATRLDEKELADAEGAEILELARRKRERGEDVVEVDVEAPAADAPAEGEASAEGERVVDLMALLKERLKQRDAATPASERRAAGEPARRRQRAAASRTGGAHAARGGAARKRKAS
jgi:DNA end-binding protein Ku